MQISNQQLNAFRHVHVVFVVVRWADNNNQKLVIYWFTHKQKIY